MSRFLAILTTALMGIVVTAGQERAGRLDRARLLEFRDDSGTRREVDSLEDWQLRRGEILAGMESVMGAFPASARRVDLDIEVIGETDMGAYFRRAITYQSEPGSRTAAYLCVPSPLLAPAGERSAPAVLCLHPTDQKNGNKVVVGLGGKEGRQYAAELAELGYVTLSPAYPLMADYQPDLARLDYQSGTMKAIWDNSRALDLLESLDFVDSSNGFGVIGHSLGGHNAIFTAVFEARLRVVVSSCGFDSFLDYYAGAEANWNPGRGWCQTRYMPRLAAYRGRLQDIPFDFHELLGAIAPRRVFISAPRHDSNFQRGSVEACVAAARPVYEMLGAPEKLTVAYPDCDHNFPKAIRLEAYRAIESTLRPKIE